MDRAVALAGGCASSALARAMHAAARMAGLLCAAIDDAYLAAVRADLLALLDDRVGHLGGDATRMHTLEHRMHRLGPRPSRRRR